MDDNKFVSAIIYRDGDQICILVGPNLQEGVAGFGPTLAAALMDFTVGVTSNPNLQGNKFVQRLNSL